MQSTTGSKCTKIQQTMKKIPPQSHLLIYSQIIRASWRKFESIISKTAHCHLRENKRFNQVKNQYLRGPKGGIKS